jgi:hypothetical protein
MTSCRKKKKQNLNKEDLTKKTLKNHFNIIYLRFRKNNFEIIIHYFKVLKFDIKDHGFRKKEDLKSHKRELLGNCLE